MQQRSGQSSELPQPTHLSVGQNGWTTPLQNFVASKPDQTLIERLLDSALTKIREHEEMILQLAATLSGQSVYLLRNQHGAVYLDRKQEIGHAGDPLTSCLQPPYNSPFDEHRPASMSVNPAGFQNHHFTSRSANRDSNPPTSVPHITATSPSGRTVGDPEWEPERKRARPNVPEERSNTSQRSNFPPFQSLTASNLHLPSFNNFSKLPFTKLFASEAIIVPEAPADDLTWDYDATESIENWARYQC